MKSNNFKNRLTALALCFTLLLGAAPITRAYAVNDESDTSSSQSDSDSADTSSTDSDSTDTSSTDSGSTDSADSKDSKDTKDVTADGNSPRHTGNVAGTHGGRQRGTHRLEGGHCTIGSIPLAEHAANRGFDGIGEFADLDKAGAHTEQQPHADDAHHGGNAPDKVVDCLVDSRDRLQHMLYPYFPLQIS